MIIGVFLILMGILIAVFPLLISYMIAFLLVMVGAGAVLTAIRFRTMKTRVDNKFVEFLVRF